MALWEVGVLRYRCEGCWAKWPYSTLFCVSLFSSRDSSPDPVLPGGMEPLFPPVRREVSAIPPPVLLEQPNAILVKLKKTFTRWRDYHHRAKITRFSYLQFKNNNKQLYNIMHSLMVNKTKSANNYMYVVNGVM